ncbi:uncharacterized protein LOC144088063 isoform X3 [Stigmatopora argus]
MTWNQMRGHMYVTCAAVHISMPVPCSTTSSLTRPETSDATFAASLTQTTCLCVTTCESMVKNVTCVIVVERLFVWLGISATTRGSMMMGQTVLIVPPVLKVIGPCSSWLNTAVVLQHLPRVCRPSLALVWDPVGDVLLSATFSNIAYAPCSFKKHFNRCTILERHQTSGCQLFLYRHKSLFSIISKVLDIVMQSSNRRANFSTTPRRQQRQHQQNNAASIMQSQHGGLNQQETLPSHCLSPISQRGQSGGVGNQSVPDPHQGRASTVSPQNSQPNMRSSTSSKHISSSSTTATSSYSLLQPLVPEVKEMNLGYTRLSANLMVGKKTSIGFMPKHQDTFSLTPQRPLTSINPIGHSLHPNGATTLKPSPVARTIQSMPWEQRSLYNQ